MMLCGVEPSSDRRSAAGSRPRSAAARKFPQVRGRWSPWNPLIPGETARLWHRRHRPTCRLATIRPASRPRRPWRRSARPGSESPAKAFPARNENAIALTSHQFNCRGFFSGTRADALAGRPVERVQHRRAAATQIVVSPIPPQIGPPVGHPGWFPLSASARLRIELYWWKFGLLDAAVLQPCTPALKSAEQAVDETTPATLALDLRRWFTAVARGRLAATMRCTLTLLPSPDRDSRRGCGRRRSFVEAMQLLRKGPRIDAAGRGACSSRSRRPPRFQHAEVPSGASP